MASARPQRVLGTRRDLAKKPCNICVKSGEPDLIVSIYFTRLVSNCFWPTRKYSYRWNMTTSSRPIPGVKCFYWKRCNQRCKNEKISFAQQVGLRLVYFSLNIFYRQKCIFLLYFKTGFLVRCNFWHISILTKIWFVKRGKII